MINSCGYSIYDQVINHVLCKKKKIIPSQYSLSLFPLCLLDISFLERNVLELPSQAIDLSTSLCSSLGLLVYISGLFYAAHTCPWLLCYLFHAICYNILVFRMYPSYILFCLIWKLPFSLTFVSDLPSCIFFHLIFKLFWFMLSHVT